MIYATAVLWHHFIQSICDPNDHNSLNLSDELCSYHPAFQVLSAVVQPKLLPMLHCLSYEARNRMATGVSQLNHS
jgi:hypothetical protein